MNIGIISTGKYIEGNKIDNLELTKQTKNFIPNKKSLNEWILDKFGVITRYKSNINASDLAVEACKNALSKFDKHINEIDFIILNTVSGDYKQPTTATAVQTKLGMKINSFAIEINMPCAGNIYGLSIAKSFIQAGIGKYGLVVGVDKMTSIIDEEDFILSSLFGDAAACCLVGERDKLLIEDIFLQSKSDEKGVLKMESSGSRNPISIKNIQNKNHLLKMKGKETSIFIHETITQVIKKLISSSELKIEELDQVIIHQASIPIIKKTMLNLGFKEEQFLFTLPSYGNTSSASIFLTLNEYLLKNKDPKNIFLIGMGAGFNWGGIYLKS